MKLYTVLHVNENGMVTGQIRIFKRKKDAIDKKNVLMSIFPKECYIIEDNKLL